MARAIKIKKALARARWLIERRITASTYLIAAALMVLITISFGGVYQQNFQAFIGEQRQLHEEHVRVLAKQLEPSLKLMGIHAPLLTLVPSKAKLVNYEVMLDHPPLKQLARELENAGDDHPGRIDGFGAVRVHSTSGDYLYFIARLAALPLQPRILGSGLLISSDYFAVRYETTARAFQYRLVAYESKKEATAPLIAEAAGYVAAEDLFPRVRTDLRDRQIRGGAYLNGGRLYLLLRLQLNSGNEAGAAGTPETLSPENRLTIAWGSNAASMESAATSLCRLARYLGRMTVAGGIQSLGLLVGRTSSCAIPIAGADATKPSYEHNSWFERFHVWLATRIVRSTASPDDDELISRGAIRAAATLNVDAGTPVQLEATQSLASMIAAWRANSNAQLQSFMVPMLGIALLTLIFHITVLRRIRRLSDSARVRKGTQFATPELLRNDEIGVLAKRFAGLLKVRDAKSAKLQSINGTLQEQSTLLRNQNELLSAANKQLNDTAQRIQHNVRSPLERLQNHLNENSREGRLLAAALRAAKDVVTDQVIAAATRPLALHQYMREWCEDVAEETHDENVLFHAPHRDVWARADENGLEDTLERILNNARDFRIEGTPLTLSVATDDRHATIHFHNCGQPIPEHLLEKIFEDHYTTRQGLPGHVGLGLYEAHRFVTAMGGELTASNDDSGVEFQIRLLLAQPAVQDSSSE